MGDIANITLSKDLIEPIVRAQLQASITAALGRSDQLIAQVVQTVMNQKVDSNGSPSRYNSDTPLITWLCDKAIKEAALEAIKEWFAENKEEMKKQLRMSIQRNAKGLADQFVLGMGKAVETSHTSKVEIIIRPKS